MIDVVERLLARATGVRLDEARLLADSLARDRRRRVEARARQGGLSADSLDTLLAVYLALGGLSCAVAAVGLRAQPGRAAFVLLLLLSLFALGLAFSDLFQVLLADEGFRVIASWPVRSQSFLYARLGEPTRRLGKAMLLLAVPSALALAVCSGIPLLTGAVFLATAMSSAVALLWLVAALYTALLAGLGAARARAIGTVLQIGGLLAPLCLGALLKRLTPAWLDPTLAPRALPITWLAMLVQASAGRLPSADAWMLAAAFAWLLLGPLAAFALTARHYTRGLATARPVRTRPPWTPPIDWVLWFLRRPTDRVVVRLIDAHARFDWRFRAQVLAVPLLLGGLLFAGAAGIDLRRLFSDPLRVHGVWHPAMLFVVAALVQPLVALPIISGSAEHRAAWILRAGVHPAQAFIVSSRRVVRVLFLAPMLLLFVLGYVWAGIPLLSLVVHIATLTALAELVARAVQRAFPYVPFSRPVDDDELAKAFLAAGMLVYIGCGLVALAVVHVLYRSLGHWL